VSNSLGKEIRHSVCALDCPDACSLLLTVEDGKATKLRGNPDHPVTNGFLCGKVARYLDREYSPARLLYPQRRVGSKGEGRFERIGWDEALDEIASRLGGISNEFGPEAVLPYSYGGTLGVLNGSSLDRRFFHRFGASRLDRTICASAGAEALNLTYGNRHGVEPEQFTKAKLIIAWGANILGANVHLWPFIVEARRNGARFYVIDPVRNRNGHAADRHFAVNPGSDQALALGLMHVIIAEGLQDADYLERHTNGFGELAVLVRDYPPERVEELTGIAAEDIVNLAREYATTTPSVIRLNYGVQRSERGGAAVRAVSILPALTGAWRHAGGGLQLTTSGGFRFNYAALERDDLQQISLGREARLVNMSELGKALNDLDDPPVKALVVYNSNPAAVAPNQNKVLKGLRRDDLFTVVMEQFLTDTARYADILLPATTFLENTDLYFSYGHYHAQLARPALPAPGECRSNVEVFRALAGRIGFDDACFADSEDEMIRQALNSGHPFLDGISLERLDAEHFARLNISPVDEPFLPYADGGFETASGKCEFDSGSLGYVPPVESRLGDGKLRASYPLEFVSPKSDEGLNSTFGNRQQVDRVCDLLHIHPSDAGPRGVDEGDRVRLRNDRGRCTFEAQISDDIQPGVVSARSVRWIGDSGSTCNALTSERLTDIGGGATFYSCLVEVEKC
jgi:anaerobic selenocysteine-containing dehydrogenase